MMMMMKLPSFATAEVGSRSPPK